MAKAKKILKIVLVAILFIGLLGYVVYAMVAMSTPDPEERCSDVQLVVKKNPKARFIDEKEVENILRNAGLYPKGELMNTVDTRKIEELFRANDFVEKVECYKTSNGKLCVTIEQRTPVLYVLPEGRDGYFVDVKGNVIAKTAYAANLLVATGNVDKQFACTDLLGLAVYIQSDEFWNNQIEQIYIKKDKHKTPVLELVPRVGDHIVNLGHIEEFEKKLDHLRTFYSKALGSVGWNKYEKIDLQYSNQVICTKHKK